MRDSLWLAAAAWASATLVSCSHTPSLAPLGGTYSAAGGPQARDRKAATEVAPAVDASAPAPSASAASTREPHVPSAVAIAPAEDARDRLKYLPLKVGDPIAVELSLSFAADVVGGAATALGNDPSLKFSAKIHVDVKVVRATPQSLDELTVTLKPGSFDGTLAGNEMHEASGPPETFTVTLGGRSPGIVSQSGTPARPPEVGLLTFVVLPLAEFQRRWGPSPVLDLKPNWADKLPITLPSFVAQGTGSVSVGPLEVRYLGRADARAAAPFSVALPVVYDLGVGKVNLNLSGTARLSPGNARPTSVEVEGPLTGEGTVGGSKVGLRGSTKLSATLSYP